LKASGHHAPAEALSPDALVRRISELDLVDVVEKEKRLGAN
jgi:hypothetical protein